MKMATRKVRAAHLQPGDVIHSWRGRRYEDYVVTQVEVSPGQLGGRIGAYPECLARVFTEGRTAQVVPAEKVYEVLS